MAKNVERTIDARLRARELSRGVWRLSSEPSDGMEIILCGVEPEAGAGLADILAIRAVISWSPGGAVVRLFAESGHREIRARTAILHEPKALLYDALPLARLDDAARRFWRRVFVLVRIPGGRRLLGLMARRAGSVK